MTTEINLDTNHASDLLTTSQMKDNRSISIGRSFAEKNKLNNKKNKTALANSENLCLNLLREYPFNSFFINFICYIRDSLFNYFKSSEEKRNGQNVTNQKEYVLIKETFIDFESQMEPMISILKDMCNTVDEDFNDFIRNLILRYCY